MSLLLLSSAFSKYLILELKQRPVSFSATVSDIDTFIQYVEFLQNTPNQHRQHASQKQATFHWLWKRLSNARSFMAINAHIHITSQNPCSLLLKGSAVFPYHSQQLFLCLSWAQDISDQQKRPAGHFSALLEWRSQRMPLTATIEYIGKQLPEQKKQHNAERRERRIVLAQRTMNRD